MNVTAIYFSPTGGTKKYAEAMARAMDENFTAIDLTRPVGRDRAYTFGPEDLVIFGAPVYAGRLPIIAGEAFADIKGENTNAVFLVTYGNRDVDDALMEMKTICQSSGFRGIAAAALLAEHTYSDKLAGGRPSPADLEETADFAGQIMGKLENQNGQDESVIVPGVYPYSKEAKRMPKLTETGVLCTECGLCVRLCPVGAIEETADMEANQEKCIGCLACVKGCPRGGRLVHDPAVLKIRETLEPIFGGVDKANRFFI